MPHIKGESYTDFNSSYEYVYTDYLPVEFFCNGIISACLTFVNIVCIFITAIIVLKVRKHNTHLGSSYSQKQFFYYLFCRSKKWHLPILQRQNFEDFGNMIFVWFVTRIYQETTVHLIPGNFSYLNYAV